MSHGGGGTGHSQQSAEPNLTPLLDMVLQLVMFFMLVANFVMDELSDKIRLPVATQAKPLSVKDTNIMYLNVDRTGRVLVPLGEPLLTPDQIVYHMRMHARNHVEGEARAKELVTVIIRADRDARFQHVHKVMTAIKQAGYRKIQFRAQIQDASR